MGILFGCIMPKSTFTHSHMHSPKCFLRIQIDNFNQKYFIITILKIAVDNCQRAKTAIFKFIKSQDMASKLNIVQINEYLCNAYNRHQNCHYTVHQSRGLFDCVSGPSIARIFRRCHFFIDWSMCAGLND